MLNSERIGKLWTLTRDGAGTLASRMATITRLLTAGVLKNLDLLFEQHRFVRRTLVFWAMWMITFVTIQMFTDISLISNAAAAAYATLVGILGVVLGFYQWMREKDSKPNE